MAEEVELEAEDAVQRLHAHIKNHYGSINRYCAACGHTPSYIQRMLNMDQPLSDKVAAEIGLEKHRMIIHYYTLKSELFTVRTLRDSKQLVSNSGEDK